MGTFLIIAFFVGLFIVYVIVMAIEASGSNKDYAAEFPTDPFSRGMDAAWKGKGPPPTEQDRSGHIRTRILGAYFDPYSSQTPAELRKLAEATNKSADEVAARAKAAALARRDRSGSGQDEA